MATSRAARTGPLNYLRLASAAQFCSTVRPASASAACQLGVPNTIWKPAVVLLATKYVWLAAARSAVSISSRLVSGVAASTSVTTVVMVRISRVR